MPPRFLVLALLAICSSNAAAQSVRVSPGDRVRFTAPVQYSRQVAEVVAIEDDGLVLQPLGAKRSVTLPWSSMTELDLSRGEHRPVLKGMGSGVLAGAAIGFVIGAVQSSSDDGLSSDGVIEGDALTVALAGGAIGTVVGGAIGYSIRTERWAEVPLNQFSARVEAAPRVGGLALAVHLLF